MSNGADDRVIDEIGENYESNTLDLHFFIDNTALSSTQWREAIQNKVNLVLDFVWSGQVDQVNDSRLPIRVLMHFRTFLAEEQQAIFVGAKSHLEREGLQLLLTEGEVVHPYKELPG